MKEELIGRVHLILGNGFPLRNIRLGNLEIDKDFRVLGSKPVPPSQIEYDLGVLTEKGANCLFGIGTRATTPLVEEKLPKLTEVKDNAILSSKKRKKSKKE